MTNKALDDARALLMAAKSEKAPVLRDAIAVFVAKIDAQIVLAKEAGEGKTINTRSAWFKKTPTGYSLKIGRDAIDMGQGVRLFAAKDLAEVGVLLETAKVVIAGDDAIRRKIVAASNARSERLRKSRAK